MCGAAQGHLGEQAFCFLARIGEGDDRIAPDRDEPAICAVLDHKAFGAALRDAAAEVLEGVIPMGFLPFVGGGSARTLISVSLISLSLASANRRVGTPFAEARWLRERTICLESQRLAGNHGEPWCGCDTKSESAVLPLNYSPIPSRNQHISRDREVCSAASIWRRSTHSNCRQARS